MAEWLYEAGIGEARAALVDRGRIVEAVIEPDDGAIRWGTVVDVRLVERLSPHLARVEWPTGAGMLNRPPPHATLGQVLRARVVREAVPEGRRWKLPKLVWDADAAIGPGPDLLARCKASGHPVTICTPYAADLLEHAGWSEVLSDAETGEVAFTGGMLRITLTPAMTVMDVDGTDAPAPLAQAAASAAAETIRLWDIGGSIGIDFPTLAGKTERQSVAAALDTALAQPFERTAVNGFGFLQLIRPRHRMSLAERMQHDPVATATRAILRQLERLSPNQPAPARLARPIIDRMEQAGWRAMLVKRLGFDPLEPR